ncbi:unnamed protein product [Withania somnifera]
MERQNLASSSSPPQQDGWINTYQNLLPHWQSLPPPHRPAIPISISRVNQVNAGRLDIEMSAMLKEQLVKVFSLMEPTPGNALMNLRYRDERASEIRGKVRTGLEGPGLTVAQKIWYCVATVSGQCIWARLQSFSAIQRWGDSELIYKAASFSNLLLFLFTGRAVSFEYMNRQLVWNEFSELLLLLLPLLNSSSVNSFLRPFSKDKSSDSSVDETLCAICQGTINSICSYPLYCYYCLQTRCSAVPLFGRPTCGEQVAAICNGMVV